MPRGKVYKYPGGDLAARDGGHYPGILPNGLQVEYITNGTFMPENSFDKNQKYRKK